MDREVPEQAGLPTVMAQFVGALGHWWFRA